MKKLTIGLIGNPNSGKTTLFNQLTGSRQRVGNWAGVTVERKEGQFSTTDHQVTLVDLPGTYSLTTISSQTSLDEQIACHYILSGDADLLINVVDASNLERNLYLTLQLLELGIPCIVALNMLDIAEKQNIRIEIDALSARLGCPVIPLVSTRGRGIEALKLAIDRYKANENVELVHYAQPLLNEADSLAKVMPSDIPLKQRRWLGLQMLEGDIYSRAYAGEASQHLDAALARLRNEMDDPALHIADARYQCIAAICDVVSNTLTAEPSRFTTAVDKIVLNRFLGLPIFLFVMYLMFLLAINIGGALQPLFDVGSVALFVHGIQWIGYTLHFPDWLTIFLAQGLGGGINTVLPLVPQIGMMYLFLSFLEDSGYMARAAFVMDRLMQALGLPGKSFVPLIVGFGCNVPSVMGARTLDAPRERLMTIMMAPFMSCGARLAIFAVFAAAFFGQNGALAVFSLYMLGIVMAVLTGLMLKYTIMRGEATPFVMELPVYHVPHVKSLVIQTWQRLKGFVLRAGKVIIIVSIFLSAFNSFSLSGKIVDNINDSAERFSSLGSQMESALKIDADAFRNAIRFNMTEDDLAELMKSKMMSTSATYESNLQSLGYASEDDPSQISIYPLDFEQKAEVLNMLDSYNAAMREQGAEDKVIQYTDVVGTLMTSVTRIINMISNMLVAFVSISLVVSSIMIGIITYISVLERRKEIGILRAIGASKRNISEVFNAETFIIGLCSGLMGIGLSRLLLIPGNMLIQKIAAGTSVVAVLPWKAAVVLVALATVLTILGGFIPAKTASRSDPVKALRAE